MVMVTPYRAQKGDPVAVVYYRCEHVGGATECTPHGGFYYVHNGVALEDLPNTKDGGAWVSHVARWNQTAVVDKLYICGAETAAKAVEGVHCHGDRDDKNDPATWKAWVVKAIYTYSIGQPIAWRTTVSGKDPTVHNGVFKCFQEQNSKDCDPDIRNAGGKGTLEFWHYVNANPDTSNGENGRTAKWWEKFTLQLGKDVATGVADKIEITSR